MARWSLLGGFLALLSLLAIPKLLAEEIDAAAQLQVTHILQRFVEDYWNTAEGKAAVTNHSAVYTNAETAFREACRLLPQRLDLRFDLASCLIGQAAQTNGAQLQLKVRSALQLYRELEQLDPSGFEAPLLRAAYARAIEDTNEFEAAFSRLTQLAPDRAADYLQKFTRTEEILATIPCETVRRGMNNDKFHAVVILGAGLETNGTVKTKLVSRLKQGRRLARLYRQAPVIITGGNPKNGLTEAYAMSSWLSHHGVARKRLILEDKARDTVENALFCSAILQRLKITEVTIVTSVSHLRRGWVDLEQACRHRGLQVQFDHLAARAETDPKLDPVQERVGVFRDLLRVSGIWAYPGLQR